jgi:hypothetical protein
LIKDVSVNGRACKQTPTLNALAICARSNDPKTKAAALDHACLSTCNGYHCVS